VLLKGKIMKLVLALIASLSMASAFAAEPAKKEEKKAEVKPAAAAPAAPAKKDDKKAADAKSEAKPAAKADDKKAEAPKK